ncbi:MAG: STAS domain-containing protein [Myxococcales bacterium]
MNDKDQLEIDILDRLADVLMVLSEVTSSDYSSRLKSDLSDDHPISALYKGINETVESLAATHARMTAYQAELEEKLLTIERQRAAIHELSTPVIEIWEGVVCLPVVGVMDTARSADMTEAVLKAVVEKSARCAIIDITGIEIMDTGTADHFIRMAKAIRLLGARCVLTGISPTIAQTIVHMGVQLDGVTTRRCLRDALQDFVTSSGRKDDGGRARERSKADVAAPAKRVPR